MRVGAREVVTTQVSSSGVKKHPYRSRGLYAHVEGGEASSMKPVDQTTKGTARNKCGPCNNGQSSAGVSKEYSVAKKKADAHDYPKRKVDVLKSLLGWK